MSTQATLSIVATPIGNLEDLTFRARSVLEAADILLAEDTRVTKKLLQRYALKKTCVPFHQHSHSSSYTKVIDALKSGKHVALVTDAGTPGISDPGNKLVAAVYEALGGTVRIEPIPGPSALTAALSIAGMPTDRFIFYGFIPHKKGRQKLFSEIAESDIPVVFYESPHRIIKTLTALSELIDKKRPVVVARELTKKFETVYRGTITEVAAKVKEKPKGEFVIVISGT